MEFIQMSLEIPEVIQELVRDIRAIEPNSTLSGGFLCDLYLNQPFKDVDIFIHHQNRIDILQFLKDKKRLRLRYCGDEYTDFTRSLDGVYEADVKGYPVQFIFSYLGTDAVEDFDVRMRRWYYDGDRVYADKEAIEDINERRIYLENITDGLDSLHRVLRFEKKYGFMLNEDSQKKLNQYLLISDINYRSFKYSREKIEDIEVAKRFEEYISNLLQNCDENLLRFIWKQLISSKDTIEELLQLNPKPLLEYEYTFSKNPYLSKIKTIEDELKQLVKIFRTKLVYGTSLTSHLDDWNQHIEDPTYIHTVLKQQIEELTTSGIAPYDKTEVDFLTKAVNLFEKIKGYTKQAAAHVKTVKVQTKQISHQYRALKIDEFRGIVSGKKVFLQVSTRREPLLLDFDDLQETDPMWKEIIDSLIQKKDPEK